jgi:hypothetical protein
VGVLGAILNRNNNQNNRETIRPTWNSCLPGREAQHGIADCNESGLTPNSSPITKAEIRRCACTLDLADLGQINRG